MNDYIFYVPVTAGGFGHPLHAAHEDDARALEHGRLLASRHGGCDIWRGARRVALMASNETEMSPARRANARGK